MSELGPGARRILDYLQKKDPKTFVRLYDAEELFHRWDNYVRRVSFFNRYPDFTDHGPGHVNSVVTLAAELAFAGPDGPAKPCLSRAELFCLAAVGFLHDIGMYSTKGGAIESPGAIREVHALLSRRRMLEERESLFPNVPERDVALIGTIAAFHQSSTFLDSAHRDRCRGEAERSGRELKVMPGLGTLEEELAKSEITDGVATLALCPEPVDAALRIRVSVVAALLRLLDQSDIQVTRAGNIDFLVRRLDKMASLAVEKENLLGALKPEAEAWIKRTSKEREMCEESTTHYLKDFWVERTFIADRSIYVKLNSPELMKQQMTLVPASLQSSAETIGASSGKDYFDEASTYIRKELDVIGTRLAEEGIELEVRAYPLDEAGQLLIRKRLHAARIWEPGEMPGESIPMTTGEAESVSKDLASDSRGRIIVVFGMSGRGKRHFVDALAKNVLRREAKGDETALWWHTIQRRRESQVQSAIQEASAYLASCGEFALANVFQEEGLVTEVHTKYFLEVLKTSPLPRVLVLQYLNHVDKSYRSFFARCFDSVERRTILATTTRWPGPDAMQDYFAGATARPLFIEAPRPGKAAVEKVLARLAKDRIAGSGGRKEAFVGRWLEFWEKWGREGVVLELLPKAIDEGAGDESVVGSVMSAYLAGHFADQWSSISNATVHRAASAALLAARTEGMPLGRVAATEGAQAALQELWDRSLARWEGVEGRDPWLAEDQVRILTEKPTSGTFAWLHPGLRNVLARPSAE